MSENEPLMRFESDASAPILRYDIPSPTSYAGRHEIELDISVEIFDGKPENGDEGTKAYAKPTLKEILDLNRHAIDAYLAKVTRNELVELAVGLGIRRVDPDIEKSIATIGKDYWQRRQTAFSSLRTNYARQRGAIFPFYSRRFGLSTISQIAEAQINLLDRDGDDPKPETKAELFNTILEAAFNQHKVPVFYKTMGGRVKVDFVDMPAEALPVLTLVEKYQLSTFPGDYGAGNTAKTISLLPGEERQISVKTWKKSQTSISQASSLLDSYTEDKADEFEEGVQTEDSTTSRREKTSSYHAEAKAEASWGFGSAEISGGTAGSSGGSRESFAKNVMNATEKHAQSSSAKREINVETSYERTAEQGEEETITRTIKNLNASRVLNFVFRQMNQEWHSLLHLRDIRLGFRNGFPGSYREYALYEIPVLVRELLCEEFKDPADLISPDVKVGDKVMTKKYLEAVILNEYGEDKVFDYEGNTKTLVETVETSSSPPADDEAETPAHQYIRVIPPKRDGTGKQKYMVRAEKPNPDPNLPPLQKEYAVTVEGIMTAASRITMRTDGLIVESLLGKAAALDQYSLDTQIAVLRRKEAHADRLKTGLKVVDELIKINEPEKAAAAYEKMFNSARTEE